MIDLCVLRPDGCITSYVVHFSADQLGGPKKAWGIREQVSRIKWESTVIVSLAMALAWRRNTA